MTKTDEYIKLWTVESKRRLYKYLGQVGMASTYDMHILLQEKEDVIHTLIARMWDDDLIEPSEGGDYALTDYGSGWLKQHLIELTTVQFPNPLKGG